MLLQSRLMAKKPAPKSSTSEAYAYDWRSRNNLKPSKPMTVKVKGGKSKAAC